MATLMPICTGFVGLKSEKVKISSASVRPKWPYKQQTHISAAYLACPEKALVRREREPKTQRSDRREKRSSKEALADPFRRRKSEFIWLTMLRIDFENCASCLGRDHIFVQIVNKYCRKRKMHRKDLRWRVWCLYVRAWWGQKVRVLEFNLFLKAFFEVSKGPRAPQPK